MTRQKPWRWWREGTRGREQSALIGSRRGRGRAAAPRPLRHCGDSRACAAARDGGGGVSARAKRMLRGEVGGAGRKTTTPPSKTTHDGRRATAGADRDLCRETGGRRPEAAVFGEMPSARRRGRSWARRTAKARPSCVTSRTQATSSSSGTNTAPRAASCEAAELAGPNSEEVPIPKKRPVSRGSAPGRLERAAAVCARCAFATLARAPSRPYTATQCGHGRACG